MSSAGAADPPLEAKHLAPAPAQGGGPRKVPVVRFDVEDEVPPQPGRVKVAKREYRPLEPIVVDFEAQNRSDREWLFLMGSDRHENKGLSVIAPGSKPAPETAYAQQIRFRFLLGRTDEVMPGATAHFSIVANLLRDMTAPGEYTVVVAMPIHTVLPDGRMANCILRSEPVTVVVKGPPFTKGE